MFYNPEFTPVLQFSTNLATPPSVARMITVSTPTITYTSAQQVTDFGATQASVTMDVFQLSQRVGRGNVLTITGQI